MMRVVIGADHAGFDLKEKMKQELISQGYEILDIGAHEYVASDDYPDFAIAVARAVAAGQAPKGIVFCGSGVGATVAANKIKGARACLCHDIYSAVQGVEHDDLNIICLGGQIVGPALARQLIKGFLQAQYAGEERFQRRLDKVLALENTN
jgi:ribose 5-phosphate isomerase B